LLRLLQLRFLLPNQLNQKKESKNRRLTLRLLLRLRELLNKKRRLLKLRPLLLLLKLPRRIPRQIKIWQRNKKLRMLQSTLRPMP